MPAVVLILAEQPVIAALLGVLVELAGYQAVFAEPGEQPTDAVQRVTPRAVMVVDLSLDEARSDLFFGHAAKRRVGVTLFGPAARETELAQVASSRGVPWFTIPSDTAELTRAIEAATIPEWRIASSERRQPPSAESAGAGTRVFLDGAGTRWLVYDRRRTERRAGSDGAEEPSDIVERLFISEAGHRRSCEIQIGEADDDTPAVLELQLARAVQL